MQKLSENDTSPSQYWVVLVGTDFRLTVGQLGNKKASPERFEHSRAKHNRWQLRIAGDPVNHSGKVTSRLRNCLRMRGRERGPLCTLSPFAINILIRGARERVAGRASDPFGRLLPFSGCT